VQRVASGFGLGRRASGGACLSERWQAQHLCQLARLTSPLNRSDKDLYHTASPLMDGVGNGGVGDEAFVQAILRG